MFANTPPGNAPGQQPAQGFAAQQPAQQGAMSFAAQAGKGSDLDNALLPNNQMAYATVTVKEVKTNLTSGKRSAQLELTICAGQPFEGRKIWMYLADPWWQDNYVPSPKGGTTYGEQAQVHICRMLEIGKSASAANPAAYDLTSLEGLEGLVVAIRTGIEKGTNGYSDKTKIVEFLSNCPESASAKMFLALTQGIYNWDEAKKAQSPGADAVASQTAAPAMGTGAPPMAAAVPATNGVAPQAFPQGQSQPQQQGQQFPVNTPPATAAVNQPLATAPQAAPHATAAATFPSNQAQPAQEGFNPGATPSFIAQSNQQ